MYMGLLKAGLLKAGLLKAGLLKAGWGYAYIRVAVVFQTKDI